MIRRGVRARATLAAWCVLSIHAVGCVAQRPPAADDSAAAEPTRRLEAQLSAIAADASPAESHLLAETAIHRSQALAEAYRMTRPALFHNVLVNVGLRDRGLCWHWTEDLLATLGDLPLPSYELHWGTAYRGELFREHNTVIVTARGEPFASGLVLDPWRDAGELFWARVSEDRYPWEPR